MPYRLEYRAWLSENGRRLLGEEDAGLLRRIRETRSLTAAAEAAGMGVDEAMAMLDSAEESSGVRLVDRDESSLTAEGDSLLCELDSRCRRMADQLEHLYRNPVFGADGIIIQDGKVLLVKRANEPFAGMYALPGGFMDHGETSEEAAVREVEEETGLRTEVLDLVGAYTRPGRDPRGHICTLAYRLVVRGGGLRAGDDAAEAAFFDLDSLPPLAFDHRRILDDVQLMLSKLSQNPKILQN